MIYWDTSAIITLLAQGRLGEIKGVTRPHALAEFYSRTTGKGFMASGRVVKLTPELAHARVRDLQQQLAFVELSAGETVAALAEGVKLGIHGGRTHDLLHATAARKAKATVIYTYNFDDFTGLTKIPLQAPPG